MKYYMNMNNTSGRLKEALKDANLTQQELANKSGVNKSSISQYVNGHNSPSIDTAERLSKVLGVNPLWLMGYLVDSNAPYKEGRTQMSIERAKELIKLMMEHFFTDFVSGEQVLSTSEIINQLFVIGFTEEELVGEFGFTEDDIDKANAELGE